MTPERDNDLRGNGPGYGDASSSERRPSQERPPSASGRDIPSSGPRERLSADYDDASPARRRAAQIYAQTHAQASPRRGLGASSLLGHDPVTRKLVIGALGIGAVLLATVGGWSLMGGHHGGIPIIGPPPGPVKDRPTDPGGMEIMSGEGADADITGKGDAHLAPGPERPDATALARQYGLPSGSIGQGEDVSEAAPGQSSGGNGSKADGAHASVPVGSALPAAIAPSTVAPSTVAPTQPSRQPDGPTHQETVPPAALDAPSSGASGKAQGVVADTSRGDTEAPAVVPKTSSQKPATPKQGAAPVRHAGPAVPAQKPLSPPMPDGRAVSPNAGTPGEGTGNREVQLAALDSEAAAHSEWEKLKAQAPSVFAGHSPSFQKTVRGDHTFIRLRIGGFADFKAARAFCVKLHAQSIACTPAQF